MTLQYMYSCAKPLNSISTIFAAAGRVVLADAESLQSNEHLSLPEKGLVLYADVGANYPYSADYLAYSE